MLVAMSEIARNGQMKEVVVVEVVMEEVVVVMEKVVVVVVVMEEKGERIIIIIITMKGEKLRKWSIWFNQHLVMVLVMGMETMRDIMNKFTKICYIFICILNHPKCSVMRILMLAMSCDVSYHYVRTEFHSIQ